VVPGRYFVAILKGIYAKGIGMEILGMEALFLFIYASAMSFWAYKKFQKKIA